MSCVGSVGSMSGVGSVKCASVVGGMSRRKTGRGEGKPRVIWPHTVLTVRLPSSLSRTRMSDL